MRRAASVVLVVGLTAYAQDARERRLQTLERETVRLQREMDGLARREKGLLGDVVRLDAAIALERARLADAGLRLETTEERLASRERACASLEAEQAKRAPGTARRVREIYKRGPAALLPRLILPGAATGEMDGVRYASYLARRDARQLAGWRATVKTLDAERTALGAEREELAARRSEASRTAAALEETRSQRAALIETIRTDEARHAQAIDELTAAAGALGNLVDTLSPSSGPVTLDVRKFRGLLDWPSDGRVTAGYGNMIHPRFKTELPHPGLDIDAGESAPFRAVFDGHVAFAAVLHGYGLTVVVEHGNGVASVYAHASALLVQSGDDVVRGQDLGRVGDSGSLQGPYLYFELRVAGKPENPEDWLRRR